ncbi:MAG: hypothetical protein GC162_11935 [Planctomycetes bacterium]|nr:hypothetical protein [Planctomycetota bacterium]
MTALLDSITLNRQAIRFLLDRRAGRLVSDLHTGQEPLVTKITYRPGERGSFVTDVPADTAHAALLRRGGRATLHIVAPKGTHDGLWHVEAQVEIQPLRESDGRLHVQLWPTHLTARTHQPAPAMAVA